MRTGGSAKAAVATAAATLTATGLVACQAPEEPAQPRTGVAASSTPPTLQRSAPATPSGSPTPQAGALGTLPAVPTRRSPTRLAAEISAVEAVLRDPGARSRDLRRAGEFGQLAGRLLARAPKRFRRAVLVRLDGRARTKTRAETQAAALLDAMTSPQPRLPRWRIVEPPPARKLLGDYRSAARRTGVPWTFLAAIHLVETRMGRIRGVSSAGARGPMQFLPATWDLYGGDGDINDPGDAILAAARLLRANGAPADMADALWHYNPSKNYVGAVTRYAGQMERSPLAYRGYWHWRVLYKHVRGTYVLSPGYPDVPARPLR
jgi:soluble lytic murein transglycosylase-like protein